MPPGPFHPLDNNPKVSVLLAYACFSTALAGFVLFEASGLWKLLATPFAAAAVWLFVATARADGEADRANEEEQSANG